MRVRVRYAKTGKLRFVSAIDLGRLWERALRKADLPIAYSEGFSPHPKVSFPDALPLGYASTGEYAELTFAAPVELETDVKALNAAFPDGLTVLHAVAVDEGEAKLAKLLQASCWDLAWPDAAPGLDQAVARVLDAPALPVLRQRKGEPVEVDLRPAIHQLSFSASRADGAGDGARVRVVLHHVEPPVRPTEVHLALAQLVPGLPEPALVTRVAQGRPVDEGLVEALCGELLPPLPT